MDQDRELVMYQVSVVETNADSDLDPAFWLMRIWIWVQNPYLDLGF
jgi:hypothetical protein